ncbi:hypothetical protein BASA81_007833 [Batrachochytrium salamandrivorans]|nr:hypothetical protein BASA81_007833 [Batrachochytrium salamandrivorans]
MMGGGALGLMAAMRPHFYRQLLFCDSPPALAALPPSPSKTTTARQQQQPETKSWLLVRMFRALLNGVLKAIRTFQLLVIFLPPLMTSPVLFLSSDDWYHHWWRQMLVLSLQTAGPAFQKLGQWASTRPDLFGLATRRDLEHFHSSVPPEPWKDTLQTLRDNGFEDDFVDPLPIGAGCIAQVHLARFKGEQVAVKIRRRNVKFEIDRDMELFCFVASTIERLLPVLKFLAIEEISQNVSEFLRSQLDLSVEGKNLSRFNEIFSSGPCKDEVAFPQPLYASPTLLIETLETGTLLSALLSLDDKLPTKLRKELGRVGVQTFLEMVIVHNFIHSDLHPGNILVKTKQPIDFDRLHEVELDRMVFIDAGLVTTLAPQDQINFVALFTAVAEGDGEKAAYLMIDRSRDPSSCRDREGFAKGMKEIVDQVALDSFRLDKVQIGSVLEKVMVLVHRHQVRMEPNFASIVVSIIVLEGVGRQLDPELDIFKTSIPMLMRADRMYQKAAFTAAVEVAKGAKRRSSVQV